MTTMEGKEEISDTDSGIMLQSGKKNTHKENDSESEY